MSDKEEEVKDTDTPTTDVPAETPTAKGGSWFGMMTKTREAIQKQTGAIFYKTFI